MLINQMIKVAGPQILFMMEVMRLLRDFRMKVQDSSIAPRRQKQIVMKALAKDRVERCSSALEFANDFAAAAAGIALINSVGNLGGYVGPFIVGWIKDSTQSFEMALYFLAACSFVSAVITFFAARATR